MTRQQRMIEAFAAKEASTRERIDRENIDVLVEMGWSRDDAAMFVGENPIEGERDRGHIHRLGMAAVRTRSSMG